MTQTNRNSHFFQQILSSYKYKGIQKIKHVFTSCESWILSNYQLCKIIASTWTLPRLLAQSITKSSSCLKRLPSLARGFLISPKLSPVEKLAVRKVKIKEQQSQVPALWELSWKFITTTATIDPFCRGRRRANERQVLPVSDNGRCAEDGRRHPDGRDCRGRSQDQLHEPFPPWYVPTLYFLIEFDKMPFVQKKSSILLLTRSSRRSFRWRSPETSLTSATAAT